MWNTNVRASRTNKLILVVSRAGNAATFASCALALAPTLNRGIEERVAAIRSNGHSCCALAEAVGVVVAHVEAQR